MTDMPAAIGPFAVRRKLGEGGMGVVYEGYDATLDRKVALKLIRRELLDRSEVRARMLREAQAMARLSHPNVVQVHQAGEHGDEIYVAMEYVEGETLTSWLRTAAPAWRLVLRTLISAGRGLAAAHAAGLVHRDFKPDNVLVGTDGRARVVDFGLAHVQGTVLSAGTHENIVVGAELGTFSRLSTQPAVGAPERAGPPVARLTETGIVLGTPVYMSPEQHFGGTVGPWSDQFSFAVAAHEALYGSRPFKDSTWQELRHHLQLGAVSPPPRDSPVPGRIFRILARGLAPTPDRRWPGLHHMLDALERDPRKTILRAAGVVAVAGVAAAGSYAIALSQRDAAQRCTGGAAELVGVWDDARAEAAERAFLATGSPFAADTWQRVRARLDAYALAWTEGHTQACEAHVGGSQSTSLFDRRTACLARRRAYLSALVDVFVAADRSVIENAVQATAALPSVASCADAEALLAAVAPPDDPQTAAEVEASRAQLARAAALESTGQYAEGLRLAREVGAAAKNLKYPPLTAEAALGEGSLLMEMARDDEADAALGQALHQALVHGLDAVAAEAAAKRIYVVGDRQGRRDVALDAASVAEALAERVRDDGRIAGLLHNNLGAVYARDLTDERAHTHYLRAVELLSRRPGGADPLLAIVHHNLGSLFHTQHRLDDSREHYDRAAKLFSEILGERHPLVAHPLAGLADVDLLQGRLDVASESFTRALALMEATHGPDHFYLLHPLVGLGKASVKSGSVAAAAAYFRRAIAIGERTGTTISLYAEALEGLAELLAGTDIEQARALLTRAVPVYEADGGPKNPAIPTAALRAGQLAAAAGDAPAARTWFERVLSDTTGLLDHAETRALAALELARMLPLGERERVCALAREAQGGVPADHPRRAEADVLYAKTCPP